MRRGPAIALVVAALVVALVAGACGLPSDQHPRPLAADDVPFALLASSTTAPPPIVAGPSVNVFFVQGDHLAEVSRTVSRITDGEVVQALLAGPTADETDVATAIPRETRLVNVVRTADGTLIIDLSSDILFVEGPEQKIAFAQLVFTAHRCGIRGVRFRIDGEDKAIPTDNGSPDRPLIPGDFSSLAPLPG